MGKIIDMATTRVGVVGGGSWGTALAKLLADKGFVLDLWVFEPEVKEQIDTLRENKVFLPGIPLPENIIASNDLEKVVSNKDLVLSVVPSHCTRDIAGKMKAFIRPDTIVVTASKGIENKTHMTMTQIFEEQIDFLSPDNLVVLSGPSFAREVANQLPTVVAAASVCRESAEYVQSMFSCPSFRVYVNDDPVGTQIGGAMKNVLAIAAGICDGMNMGLNSRAALITRGLTEMNRLGTRLGADPLTLAGLAGVGDLLLTCTGALSRNYTVGKQIGAGKKLDEIISEMRMVAEGVKTTRSVYNLSRKLGVDLPICNEVYAVLFENRPVEETVERLMNRSLKHELDGVLSF
ncbi:MAG: NAD(P)-dependent glycerol-3-phosphate dehydrogenase [Proteobacteria bacterium]|nr:NAD(P)-dependent glycerol-3-phosphate dehydrogenase [Pseudomonadota bacterium]MBU1388120.1 NAD(P)-dependent glycerol-3-phosphate dehydrogenase [Pseudomonadota bacterium]MBU1542184.1 NAD(P)-dependent glycerol-3-phosphate dehydrogenase [Pseudomonadota bacterium]MBU2429623.1 NAD(P)-dependent glycerol-3-phosphate dehydrogenase [Pseudomonadota bacterium]MBU2481660.1 NAD(P)-dependent glycerol-3-phosphate dehydrogenase [Pseudomonadota bacterium]